MASISEPLRPLLVPLLLELSTLIWTKMWFCWGYLIFFDNLTLCSCHDGWPGTESCNFGSYGPIDIDHDFFYTGKFRNLTPSAGTSRSDSLHSEGGSPDLIFAKLWRAVCSKKTSGDATGSVRGRTYSPRLNPGRPLGLLAGGMVQISLKWRFFRFCGVWQGKVDFFIFLTKI